MTTWLAIFALQAGWYWPLLILQLAVGVFVVGALIELSLRGWEAARVYFRRRRDARLDRQMALHAADARAASLSAATRLGSDRADLPRMPLHHTGVDLRPRPDPFSRSASKGFKR